MINDFEFYLCSKEISFVTLKQDTCSHIDIDLIVRSGWQAERRMSSILQELDGYRDEFRDTFGDPCEESQITRLEHPDKAAKRRHWQVNRGCCLSGRWVRVTCRFVQNGTLSGQAGTNQLAFWYA